MPVLTKTKQLFNVTETAVSFVVKTPMECKLLYKKTLQSLPKL